MEEPVELAGMKYHGDPIVIAPRAGQGPYPIHRVGSCLHKSLRSLVFSHSALLVWYSRVVVVLRCCVLKLNIFTTIR